jgi:hypothetical protein
MNRTTFGAILIFIGVVLVLSVTLPMANNAFVRFWPLLIVAYAFFVAQKMSAAYRGGLVVIGLALTADACYPSMLGQGGNWSWFWGLLLFIAGLVIILSVTSHEEKHRTHGARINVENKDDLRRTVREAVQATVGAVREGVTEAKFAVRDAAKDAGDGAQAAKEENMENENSSKVGTLSPGVTADYKGEVGTFHAAVPEGAVKLVCALDLSAGSIELVGATDKLFELEIQADSVVEPDITLEEQATEQGKLVRLNIDQHFFKGSHPFNLSTVWKLRLNRDLLLGFSGEINAARAKLDFSELRLRELNLENNASASDVRLGTREDEVSVTLENNAAKLEMMLPAGFGYVANIESNVARHNAASLMPRRMDDMWMSEDAGTNPRKIKMNVENNAASLDFKAY